MGVSFTEVATGRMAIQVVICTLLHHAIVGKFYFALSV
jgi:hypothetical protein